MYYATEIYKALIYSFASSNTQLLCACSMCVAMLILHIYLQVVIGWEVEDLTCQDERRYNYDK